MACPGEERISAFVRGELDKDAAADVEKHLDKCQSCSLVVADLIRIWGGSSMRQSVMSIASDETTVATETGDDGFSGLDEPLLVAGAEVGRYRVLECIGIGGMGVVYGAYDPHLDRRIALKVLRAAAGDGRDDRRNARLQREAQAMAKLSHPNVIAVHDVGDVNGRVFLAMEFVRGTTLTRWMRDEDRSWSEIRNVFLAAGRGLAAAHQAGLVHRDFKPDNVLIGDDGRVRVTDFGLARVRVGVESSLDDEAIAETLSIGESGKPVVPPVDLTSTGALVGTPAYMAPETYERGESNAASDQFSFCVALYEALYGQRPFAGKTLAELAAQVMAGEVLQPPTDAGVPRRVRRAVMRGLSVDPTDRHPSMTALLSVFRIRSGRLFRGWLMVTIPSGIIALSLWSLQSPASDRATLCGKDPDLAARWTAEQQRQVQSAFKATEVAYADAAFEMLDGRLEGFVRSWVGAREELCEASEEDGDPTLRKGALECLSRQKTRFDATLELFLNADESLVRMASNLVERLPDPTRCSSDTPSGVDPPPPPPEQAADIEALRADLARLDALFTAGRFEDAHAVAQEVLETSSELGYMPMVAQAHLERGQIEVELSQTEAAVESLQTAAWMGVESRHRLVTARAWISLMFVHSVMRGDIDAAHQAERAARAEVKGIGPGEHQLQEKLLRQSGTVALMEGRYEDALAAFERALEEPGMADSPMRRAHVIFSIASVKNEIGSLDAAMTHYRDFLATYEQQLGPVHPDVALAHYNIGVAYFRANRYDEALTEMTVASEIEKVTLGERHPAHAETLAGIASVLSDSGRPEEAEQYFRKSIAVLDVIPGQFLPVIHIRVNLADTLSDMGRLDEAEAVLAAAEVAIDARPAESLEARALAAQVRTGILVARGDARAAEAAAREAIEHQRNAGGEEGQELLTLIEVLAGIQREEGRPEDAIETLTEGLRSPAAEAAVPGDRGSAYFELAKAHADLADRDGALEAAAEASKSFRLGGVEVQALEVDVWVAELMRARSGTSG